MHHLALAVTSTCEWLARRAVTDQDASDVSQLLLAARSILDPWGSRLAAVAACDVMEAHPATARRDGSRLDVEARLFTDLLGWRVVRDGELGRDERSLLDDRRLVAIARRLAPGDLRDLLVQVLDTGDRSTVRLMASALPPLVDGQCGPTDLLLTSLPPDVAAALAVELGPTPETARAALTAVESLEGGLARLLLSPADPDRVADLVAMAVSDLSAVDAGPILLRYAGLVVAGGTSDDGTYRRGLGHLMAPHLLQLTSRADEWRITPRDGADLLRRILADRGAFDELIANRDHWVEDIQDSSSSGTTMRAVADLERRLDDLAGMLGWFDAIAEDEEIDDALAERALWDMSWVVIGAGVNLAIRTTGAQGPVHTVADRIADEVLHRVKHEMEIDGSVGAPATADDVRLGAHVLHDWRRTALAAAAAAAAVEVLRTDGLELTDPPPASRPTAPGCVSIDWLDDLAVWLDTVDPRSRRVVHDVVSAVLNRYQAAEACQSLA